MKKNCEFIIHGRQLKSFIKKYQPSHEYEISEDENILLKIIYDEDKDQGEIIDFIDIQTKSLRHSSQYFNAFFAYTLIRYVIPSFYGLKSSPEKFAHSEEKMPLLEKQFKVIAHLKAHHLLINPISKQSSSALLKQSEKYKISCEEAMLLPAIHALEVNMKIYENDAKSRFYKQSPERLSSIKAMHTLVDHMREHIISRKSTFSTLIDIFRQTLEIEIAINLKDHAAHSRLGRFFKWHTPQLVAVYQETLAFLSPCSKNSLSGIRKHQ